MFGWLKTRAKVRPVRPVPRVIRASYDAAQTSESTRRHWKGADDLSARAANSPSVRRVLRMRARYEVANNGYARGMGKTLANDVIGTGPRLQVTTEDADVNRTIERQFGEWMRAARLARKLRTMRRAIFSDGEAFALFITNPKLDSPVELDLRLVEADQVATPDLVFDTPQAVDGIVFDEFGNPAEYHILRQHPGDRMGMLALKYDRVPAALLIHVFDEDRPCQARAVPEVTAALPVFGRLRDYTVAVIESAKQAAVFAGVLETSLPPNGETDDLAPEETLEPVHNELVATPAGWKLNQLKAEQPTTTYGDFKGENLDEAGRSVLMPSNITRGNSSNYNYASGRLDNQTYFKAIRVEQDDTFTNEVLDRVFVAWLAEAVLIPGYVPDSLRGVTRLPHQWIWPGTEHVDPSKESTADETDLRNGTTTRQILCAKQGVDWEADVAPQLEKENALMRRIALPAPGAPAPQTVSDPTSEEDVPTNG